jgi:threonine dehydrogenase-like Zn-dependent dehydrogenase
MMSLRLLGAERIFAVDHIPERLAMASRQSGAEIIDESRLPAVETIHEWTAGRGADACIDAVGLEAHGHGIAGAYDAVKHAVHLESDRPTALRQAILSCRKNGTVSVIGVYGGLIDKLPMGAAFGKGITLRMGQVNAQRYMRPLLARIEKGEIDPSFVITHRVDLDDVPAAYQMFNDKKDGCVKVVLRP